MISILEATELRVPEGIKYPCEGREVTELVHWPLHEVVPVESRKYRRHSHPYTVAMESVFSPFFPRSY